MGFIAIERRQDNSKSGSFYCPNCKKIQNYTEVETQKYFQIANAKVFPISPKQNYISCCLCQTEFDYIVLDENSFADTVDDNETAFLETLSYCMSYVALADDEIHNSELKEISQIFGDLTGKNLTLKHTLELLSAMKATEAGLEDFLKSKMSELKYEQRLTIIRAVLRISRADGIIDPTEAESLKIIIETMSISEADLNTVYESEGI